MDFDVPGAAGTEIWGMQDNMLVGKYSDNTGGLHGFVYDGTDFSSLDYPGADKTVASDIDDNTIQFQLDGANLEREFNRTADILANSVISLNFTYLDDQKAVISAPLVGNQGTDIRFVVIDISLQSGEDTISCRAQVALMNVAHFEELFI